MYSGEDGLFGTSRFDQVSSRSGEVEVHGFLDPCVSVLEPTFEVLPPEFPGGGLFGTEYLSVDLGELWPLVVEGVGIERVPKPARSAVVVVMKRVKSSRSSELLRGLVGEKTGTSESVSKALDSDRKRPLGHCKRARP